MLTIKFDGKSVQSALAQTMAAIQEPRPMLLKIGEELADSTMRRFPEALNTPCGRESFGAACGADVTHLVRVPSLHVAYTSVPCGTLFSI